jgi:hypothetical protein
MESEASYLYAVVKCSTDESLGEIGIDERKVHTVHFEEISAVIHSCEPVPYQTSDDKLAGEWVLTHNYVIDQATAKFGTVLPFSFDTIIRGGNSQAREWLERSYDYLKAELDRVEGKAEYSVQIFYDEDVFREKFVQTDQELMSLKTRADKMSKGTAYLLQRKLDLMLKDRAAQEASRLGSQLSKKLLDLADEVRPEKKGSFVPDKYKDMKVLASFSCLVGKDEVEGLGNALDEVNRIEGVAVRFTGPWAPFSFVNLGGS